MNYELIDSGNGRRLERFGDYVLDRPDPEVLWQKSLSAREWQKADAVFRDRWIQNVSMPEKWLMDEQNIEFWVKLSPFKHTGIFPEQSSQWNYISQVIHLSNQ